MKEISGLNISRPVNLWLLANASDAFVRFVNQNYAYVKIGFDDGSTYSYDFVVGENVREWLQSGNYGETVNEVSSADSQQVWIGYRPNNEYPVVADMLKVAIPVEFREKSITTIGFYDDSLTRVTVSNPADPGFILKGMTVESEDQYAGTMTIDTTSNWHVNYNQLPIDRTASIAVNVSQMDLPMPNVEVFAEIVQGGGGLDNSVTQTDVNGIARYVLTPSDTGLLVVRFKIGTVFEDLQFNVYRPPVVIVPGHGGSFSGREILLGIADPNWHWFTDVALGGWDEIMQMLEMSGYVENETFKVAFYDWRKSLGGESPEARDRFVIPAIDAMLADRPEGQRVNLLAHSFGGLVSRSLIERSDYGPKISQLITFGTPHKGSADAYYAWEGGVAAPRGDAFYRSSVFALSHMLKKIGGFGNRAEVFRALIPSVQELMPVFSPYLYNGGYIDTASLGVGKNPLLQSQLSFSRFSRQLRQNSIEYTNVVGASHEAIGTIHVAPSEQANIWEDGKPTGTIATVIGDGTVEAAQVLLGEQYDVYSQAPHGDLPDGTRGLVAQKLRLGNFVPVVKEMPKAFFTVMILSPATAQVFDEQGNEVGEAFDLGDGEHSLVYIADPPETKYVVKLTGTGNGTYELFANYANQDTYDELSIERAIQTGEVQEIPLIIEDDQLSSLQVVDTTFKWTPAQLSIRQGVPYSTIQIALPAQFPVDQLNLNTIRINEVDTLVAKHAVTKRNRVLEIEIRTTEILRALRNRTGRFDVTVYVPGQTHALQAKGSFLIPASLRRWMAL